MLPRKLSAHKLFASNMVYNINNCHETTQERSILSFTLTSAAKRHCYFPQCRLRVWKFLIKAIHNSHERLQTIFLLL